MGWACAPTVIYNAFRLQKRAKKSHKDYTTGQVESLSRSLSTDDSGSENNSSVFTQDEDMQYQSDVMNHHRPCPCGCPGTARHEEHDSIKIRTKEMYDRSGSETVDRIFGVETLKHQGVSHCPEEIATRWRKDCRMWLWKSVENRKRKSGTPTKSRIQ